MNKIPRETFTTDEAVAFLTQTPDVLSMHSDEPAPEVEMSSIESAPSSLEGPPEPTFDEVVTTEVEKPKKAPMRRKRAEAASVEEEAPRKGRKAEHHASILSAKSLILLSLLAGPASGSDLKRSIPQLSGGKMKLLSGSLYPGLEALKSRNLVRLVSEVEGTMTYALTETGRKQAEEERNALLNFLRAPEKAILKNWFQAA